MRFELDYLDEFHVSRVTLSGVMRLPEYQAMIDAVLAEMAKQETTTLVVDLRHVTLSLSFTETSGLPDLNLKLGVPLHYRVAIMYLPYSAKATGVELYGVIARNRGYYAHQLFTSYPEATQWLSRSEIKEGCSTTVNADLALRGFASQHSVMRDQDNGSVFSTRHFHK